MTAVCDSPGLYGCPAQELIILPVILIKELHQQLLTVNHLHEQSCQMYRMSKKSCLSLYSAICYKETDMTSLMEKKDRNENI